MGGQAPHNWLGAGCLVDRGDPCFHEWSSEEAPSRELNPIFYFRYVLLIFYWDRLLKRSHILLYEYDDQPSIRQI